MNPIESNRVIDCGASLKHSLAGASPDRLRLRIGLPFLLVSPYPIKGEPLGVQPAHGPAIVKTDIDRAVITDASRVEPNSRNGIRPIFVVAEQRAVGIGQHKNGAGVHWQADERNACQYESQTLHQNSNSVM